MASNDVRIRAWLKDEVTGKLGKITDRFDHLGKSKGFQSIVSGVGMGAGIAAWNMIGDAARGAADFIGDSIEASSDQREALALNQQVFRESARTIDAWSDTTSRALGLAKTEAIDFASRFGNTLKAAGLSADELAGKSIELTERAADLGSAFNVTGDEVSTALRAGLVGEAEPLRRFGILLNAAKVQTHGLRMGLGDAHGELSEGEKVLARYALIMDESAESADMFGRDLESLADKQKIAAATMEDAQARVGKAWEPIALQVSEWQEDLALGIMALGPLWEDLWTSQEEDARRAQSAITGAVSDIKQDFRSGGRAAVTMGDDVEGATDKVILSYDEMVDALTDDTSRLIDDVYDPAILHAELAATKEEYAAQKRIATSKESTDEEIRDAKRRMLTLTKNADETRLQLLEAGELTAEETKAWLTKLERRYDKSTGKAKGDVNALIAKIKELSAVTAPGIDIVIRGLRNATGRGQQRAAGGPIDPAKVYMVGENGPEMFVSKVAGTIIPNHKLGGGGSPSRTAGGPGGSSRPPIQLTFNSTWPPTPAQAQAVAREAGPAIADYLNRRGLI